MSENHIDVSLILPAHNEEALIKKVVTHIDRALRETAYRYEIIIVNDGSQDSTWEHALSCTQDNDNLKVIGYPVNHGKGYALMKGFSHARGDLVVFLDCDLDIAPSQINYYLQALKYGDLVIASKHHPQSIVEASFLRKFLSYVFISLVKLMTGLKVQDTQSGLKAFRRKALEPVFSVLTVRRFAFDVELLSIATLHDLRIVELPIKIRLSNKLFSPFQMWNMFVDLIGITYRLRVLKWYK